MRRSRPFTGPEGCYVDRKLDGVRLQVHRVGDEVTIYTRSLDDITERLPGVVAAVRGLGAERVVLDGEVLLVADGRPRPFQETASAVGRTGALAEDLRVSWFDLLHLDGADLVDRPLAERLEALDGLVPADQVVERLRLPSPADPDQVGRGRRLLRRDAAGGSRRRRGQGRRGSVRRGSPGQRLGEGQAASHVRPRRRSPSSGAAAGAVACSPTSTSRPGVRTVSR